ncbi:hypothetical protein [Crossiella sp. CA198]|uniref:hypothetical protein n=1 Tax=Crossiella sp. CA198 TaxID=3455607 RepID=UPI003F8D35DB
MTTAPRPRPMRVLGLALLVFTVSVSVLVMHQVTHPSHGAHQPGTAAHEHHGSGLVTVSTPAATPAEHPVPGGHDSMLHLCLGLIVTVAGLLALVLLGWLRRDPAAALDGLAARLVSLVPRGPPPKLFDLDTLGVLRL